MDVEKLWAELKPKVNAVITQRLLIFHEALVERRQIPPSPVSVDPEEREVTVDSASHCNEDSVS